VKGLGKLYSHLTAQKRLRTFVSAAARKDAVEMDRLNDICPRKTYVTEDSAYWRAKVDLCILALANRVTDYRQGGSPVSRTIEFPAFANPVPEPSTWTLLALGMLCVGGAICRSAAQPRCGGDQPGK